MLMRKCLLAMLMLILVILMLILLYLNTRYADTDSDLWIKIMSLCCAAPTSVKYSRGGSSNINLADTRVKWAQSWSFGCCIKNLNSRPEKLTKKYVLTDSFFSHIVHHLLKGTCHRQFEILTWFQIFIYHLFKQNVLSAHM